MKSYPPMFLSISFFIFKILFSFVTIYIIPNKLIKNVNIKFIIQDNPRGLGDAIIKCKDYIIGDAFALMLGDDLVLSDDVLSMLSSSFIFIISPVDSL
mgnify:CR=1 FL=1